MINTDRRDAHYNELSSDARNSIWTLAATSSASSYDKEIKNETNENEVNEDKANEDESISWFISNEEGAATQNDYITTTAEADHFFTYIAGRNSTLTSFNMSSSPSTISDEQASSQVSFITKKQARKNINNEPLWALVSNDLKRIALEKRREARLTYELKQNHVKAQKEATAIKDMQKSIQKINQKIDQKLNQMLEYFTVMRHDRSNKGSRL